MISAFFLVLLAGASLAFAKLGMPVPCGFFALMGAAWCSKIRSDSTEKLAWFGVLLFLVLPGFAWLRQKLYAEKQAFLFRSIETLVEDSLQPGADFEALKKRAKKLEEIAQADPEFYLRTRHREIPPSYEAHLGVSFKSVWSCQIQVEEAGPRAVWIATGDDTEPDQERLDQFRRTLEASAAAPPPGGSP